MGAISALARPDKTCKVRRAGLANAWRTDAPRAPDPCPGSPLIRTPLDRVDFAPAAVR